MVSKDDDIWNEDFSTALKHQGVEILQNTPIGINVYGVNGSIKGTDNYERLKTSKISTISIVFFLSLINGNIFPWMTILYTP